MPEKWPTFSENSFITSLSSVVRIIQSSVDIFV